MNPEMSGSDGESSDDAEHMTAIHGQVHGAADSDDESAAGADDSECEEDSPFHQGNGHRDDDDDDALPQEEEEEDEEEEEEEEETSEEEEVVSKPPKATTKGTLHQSQLVLTHPKGKKAAAVTAVAAPSRPTPLTQPTGKSAKGSTKGGKPGRPGTFSAQTNDDSGDDLASVSMSDLSKPKWPKPAPDAVQEFEDHRTGLANGVAAGDAEAAGLEEALSHMSVHESARERVYIIKNEKVNKWFLFNPDGFVYAPNIRAPESSGLFDFTTEQLTVPSKKERIAMQERLVDAHGTQAVNTVCIAKLKTDGSGSGAGPGMHTLAMLLPGKKVPPGTEMEDIEAKMKQLGMYDVEQRKEIVVLMMLDHELAKRLYKIDKNPLPQAFNPNTNASTKYKVPARLEDTAKADTNFVQIGAAEKARRAGKRTSEDGIANSGRSDAKRAANGSSAAEGVHPEHEEDTVRICGNPTLMKVFTSKEFATSFAELRCKEDQKFTVCQAGPGKFILLLGPTDRN